jgi:hypothetical protein
VCVWGGGGCIDGPVSACAGPTDPGGGPGRVRRASRSRCGGGCCTTRRSAARSTPSPTSSPSAPARPTAPPRPVSNRAGSGRARRGRARAGGPIRRLFRAHGIQSPVVVESESLGSHESPQRVCPGQLAGRGPADRRAAQRWPGVTRTRRRTVTCTVTCTARRDRRRRLVTRITVTGVVEGCNTLARVTESR